MNDTRPNQWVPNHYRLGYEDAAIAIESMVNRIMEGKDDGTGTLGIPQLEKLRRVLLERLKPLPDFETWWSKQKQGDMNHKWRPIDGLAIRDSAAQIIWNAAQGKPEA